ncbi:MAG TPA: IS30 family transposase [Burkholderiales bacterium]|nr:IS30 family transposase [Burkholderiales bacterium]
MGGKHLTKEDRFYIEKRLAAEISPSQIAREFRVHRSTIVREIKRNTAPDFSGLYCYTVAQKAADIRRPTASVDKKFVQLTDEVTGYIHERLQVHTSSDVIAGEMRLKLGIKVSKNTIYRYLERDKEKGGTLYRLLPHRGKPYKRHKNEDVKVNILGRIGIENRPEIADRKQEPGHFEADTIFGLQQKSFLLTLVDKATKSTIIRKLPDKRAETVAAAFQDILNNTLYEFKTITSDNGTEFALHDEIAKVTSADFYFARPYHSWERGLNEHTNGLIRRFYPKGTDFNQVNDDDIAQLEHILNTRGRASLGYKSPNDVFLEHLLAV